MPTVVFLGNEKKGATRDFVQEFVVWLEGRVDKRPHPPEPGR